MHTFSRFVIALAALAATSPAAAQSLDTEVPVARRAADPPAPRAPTAQAFDARMYRDRTVALFASGAIGVGSTPGIDTRYTAGINLSLTLRNVWGGFLLDVGVDTLLNAQCFGAGCPAFQIQPSIRAGYTGAVSPAVALGLRAGYAPNLAVSIPGSAGFIHQVDGDLHVTVITRRGAMVEPFLAGGVLIGADRFSNVAPFPVALVGIRIGAAL
ncbi:MAG: hypothetical protein JNK05_32825 [Myxococcales bacterium]|nr:hypothetical protein [Myxococcales bacterium]